MIEENNYIISMVLLHGITMVKSATKVAILCFLLSTLTKICFNL
jgi:hypothetical protein